MFSAEKPPPDTVSLAIGVVVPIPTLPVVVPVVTRKIDDVAVSVVPADA